MNQNSSVEGGKPTVNVTIPERITSGLVGSFLVYKAVTDKKMRLGRLALGGYLLYRSLTGHCAAYNFIGKPKVTDPLRNVNLRAKLYVDKPRSEVYAFWRNLANLPLFMDHLAKVEVLNDNLSRWTANIPGGLGTLTWEAAIVKEEQDKMLGWNSLEDAPVDNAGKVLFKDTEDGGTEVRVIISYRVPFGTAGAGLAHLLNPVFEEMVADDIYNFKHYMEGHVPETEVLE